MKPKETKKPVHYLKHGKVIYRYVVGISWIWIETDPKTKWPEMPEYMRVRFAIETPSSLDHIDKYAFFPTEEVEKIVLAAIKKKTNEQRKADAKPVGPNRRMGNDSDKSGQKESGGMRDNKRSERKPDLPMLPFESDTIPDAAEAVI